MIRRDSPFVSFPLVGVHELDERQARDVAPRSTDRQLSWLDRW